VKGRVTTRLFVLVARRYLAHVAPVVASGTLLAGLAFATQARMIDPTQPLVRALLAGCGASSGLAIGAACLLGAAATGRSLARGSGWSALRGSGARGRDLLRAALLPLVLTASLHALAENGVAPRARAWAHARAAALEGAVAPPAGQTVRSGHVAVAADPAVRDGSPLRLAWGNDPAAAWTGHAEELGWSDGVLRARAVTLESASGVRLRASELRLPTPVRARALPIAARPTGELFASGEPYARWNAVKRGALPACGALLAAGMLAFAVRAPRVPALVPLAVALPATWTLVRVLDAAVRSAALGVASATALLVGATALGALAAWCGWRDV